MLVDALEHVDQVGVGVDVVQLAGDDQALEGGDGLGADLGPVSSCANAQLGISAIIRTCRLCAVAR
jgi:hypothetical protein